MQNHFFAILSRMKNIYRWGLMRNTKTENLSEHSLEVAFIAHALCIIENEKFGGNIDPNKAAVVAMYHDTTEIITGDMPTPIKYYNPQIKEVYKDIEGIAANKLVSMLPDYMQDKFQPIYFCEDESINKIVKAADKISAYIKCLEEMKMGNGEFTVASKTIKQSIEKMNMPCVDLFMTDFIPSFSLSLDEQN
ncbi:MAG: 5'-deoxynucleotidase [Clostridiales bacterium]|nr:5'-deoxynucleotidase [Candidatus Equinaster intestinalis]